MGFFERNRKELAARGIDPTRLPPGQYHTDRFPVLHVGDVPRYRPGEWTVRVFGLVDHEVVLDEAQLRALPAVNVTTDIHCVTKWSKFDTVWTGVRVRDLLTMAGLSPGATHLLTWGEHGYSANVPLADGTTDDALVAYGFGGADLEPEHGGPVRLMIPHLYFWKSTKWLRGIEVLAGDRPGFWERNGYHNYGDPWREQRFG